MVKKGKGGGGGGSGKSKTLPSKAGSNKDSGLPAFFKHRKLANLPDKSQNQQQLQTQKGKAKQLQLQQQQQSSQQDVAMDTTSSDAFDALLTTVSAQSANDELIFGRIGEDRETVDAALAIKDSSSKAYARELRKVIDLADVLIEVLDARDPLGCR